MEMMCSWFCALLFLFLHFALIWPLPLLDEPLIVFFQQWVSSCINIKGRFMWCKIVQTHIFWLFFMLRFDSVIKEMSFSAQLSRICVASFRIVYLFARRSDRKRVKREGEKTRSNILMDFYGVSCFSSVGLLWTLHMCLYSFTWCVHFPPHILHVLLSKFLFWFYLTFHRSAESSYPAANWLLSFFQ